MSTDSSVVIPEEGCVVTFEAVTVKGERLAEIQTYLGNSQSTAIRFVEEDERIGRVHFAANTLSTR